MTMIREKHALKLSKYWFTQNPDCEFFQMWSKHPRKCYLSLFNSDKIPFNHNKASTPGPRLHCRVWHFSSRSRVPKRVRCGCAKFAKLPSIVPFKCANLICISRFYIFIENNGEQCSWPPCLGKENSITNFHHIYCRCPICSQVHLRRPL